MDDNIKVGNRVAVNFNAAQFTLSHSATVLYIPAATGDSWVFRDNSTGVIHYVSEGCTITKIDGVSDETQ